MKDTLKIGVGIVIGFLGLCALVTLCLLGLAIATTLRNKPTPISSVGEIPSEAPMPTNTPIAPAQTTSQIRTTTPVRTPTPSMQALGQSVVYGNVKTTIVRYEFSGAYQAGSFLTEKPKSGFKFLWIYVIAQNVGNSPTYLPRESINPQFYILYRSEQQIQPDPYFSERPGYSPYQSVQAIPGVKREGWLRFSVLDQAQAADLSVLFDAAGGPFVNEYYTWQLK